MSEDLNLEQIALLVSFAEIGEKNKGYIRNTSDVTINKLFSLGLIRKGNLANPLRLKEGQDFYVISEKGKGLTYALVDHSNDLLHYWEKRRQTTTQPLKPEEVFSNY